MTYTQNISLERVVPSRSVMTARAGFSNTAGQSGYSACDAPSVTLPYVSPPTCKNSMPCTLNAEVSIFYPSCAAKSEKRSAAGSISRADEIRTVTVSPASTSMKLSEYLYS